MKISVYSRSVYGSLKIYAANPSQAVALRTLTNGAKTLEQRHLSALQDLGFEIEQIADPATVLPIRSLNSFA